MSTELGNEITIKTPTITLYGNLTIPKKAVGIAVFVYGSGSSRFSPRNKFVAHVFQEKGLATLLMDLLTKEEEEIDEMTRHLRFDIPLLADRVVLVTDWLKEQSKTKDFIIGYIGSSTGAAAALVASAKRARDVKAVVSRGGRPDLAGEYLAKVQAPTLLVIGSNDHPVIELNQKAFDLLSCEKKMEIVSGATHLFEEPGTLEEAARLASIWFMKYLSNK